MRAGITMIIELTDCLSTYNYNRDFLIDPGMIEETVYGETYPVSIEPFHISLYNLENNKFKIDGNFKAHTSMLCDRCLDTVDVPIEGVFEFEFPIDQGSPVFEDECCFIEEHQLDVIKLLKNELLINWPAKVLCSPSCKGICPVCGKNRNLGECGCDREVLDPRMARFKEVFQDFKEV